MQDKTSGTARFQVDVATGQVQVTPLTGSASTRAVFAGAAVRFASSTLIDQPGNAGLKVLNVALTNQSGLTMGATADGGTPGLRVLFGPITNLANAPTDLRAETTVEATSVALGDLRGVAVTADGTVYMAKSTDHRIYQYRGGSTSVWVGNGVAGATDGGAAAQFNTPSGLALDPADGALFVADSGNNKVRRVDTLGRVSTVAGTGVGGSVDGLGTVAKLSRPVALAFAANGDLCVACTGDNTIRRIHRAGDPALAASYTVSTVATALAAPEAIACGPDGRTYATEATGHRVRMINTDGAKVVIAGIGSAGDAIGAGNVTQFNAPKGLVWVNGGLLVADTGAHRVRWLRCPTGLNAATSANWRVSNLAGGTTSIAGNAVGAGDVARFNQPWGIAARDGGPVWIADSGNFTLRRLILPGGLMLGGSGTGTPGGDAIELTNADGRLPNPSGSPVPYVRYLDALSAGMSSAARPWSFMVPSGVTQFSFVVTVEAVTTVPVPPQAGDTASGSTSTMVRTLAGPQDFTYGFIDGQGPQARFDTISGLACDGAGNAYVADTRNNAIRMVTPGGRVSTVAGTSGAGGSTNGTGADARFNQPNGVAVTRDGMVLYVADGSNHSVRRLQLGTGQAATDPSNWTVSTVAGDGTAGAADGAGNMARFNNPYGVALDVAGNLCVTELSGNRVRRIRFLGGDPTMAGNWQVSLLAGDNSGTVGSYDSLAGTGNSARFKAPTGIAVNRNGDLLVAERDSDCLRLITPTGTATYFTSMYSVAGPQAVATDDSGYVYVTATDRDTIMRFTPNGSTGMVVAGADATSGYLDGTGDVARFDQPSALALDPAGNLFVADAALGPQHASSRVRVVQRVVKAP